MYRLTIKQPSNLLSVILDREITGAELERITAMFDKDDVHRGLRVGDIVRYAKHVRRNAGKEGRILRFVGGSAVYVSFDDLVVPVVEYVDNLVLVEAAADHEMMAGGDTAD